MVDVFNHSDFETHFVVKYIVRALICLDNHLFEPHLPLAYTLIFHPR